MILEGAGDDLRGRRARRVHEDHHLEILVAVGIGGAEGLVLVACPSARLHDDLFIGQEEIRDRDPLVEQAAGVAA